MIFDQSFVSLQAFPNFGSIGQTLFLVLNCKNPPTNSSPVPTPNTLTLFSENQTHWGMAPINPANEAPSPSATKSAGKAQQINVLAEVWNHSAEPKTKKAETGQMNLFGETTAPIEAEIIVITIPAGEEEAAVAPGRNINNTPHQYELVDTKEKIDGLVTAPIHKKNVQTK